MQGRGTRYPSRMRLKFPGPPVSLQDEWSSEKTDKAINCEHSFAASLVCGGQIPCMREDSAAALDTGAAANLAAKLAAANRASFPRIDLDAHVLNLAMVALARRVSLLTWQLRPLR